VNISVCVKLLLLNLAVTPVGAYFSLTFAPIFHLSIHCKTGLVYSEVPLYIRRHVNQEIYRKNKLIENRVTVDTFILHVTNTSSRCIGVINTYTCHISVMYRYWFPYVTRHLTKVIEHLSTNYIYHYKYTCLFLFCGFRNQETVRLTQLLQCLKMFK